MVSLHNNKTKIGISRIFKHKILNQIKIKLNYSNNNNLCNKTNRKQRFKIIKITKK
jgi:hypothetical protein